ncbi:MAG: hypothetical protein EAY66_02600 [Sphingobacteriales bacterium]|jgi:hypothetical protein|nr:MAG: hypothetical protein EAY66_02600 [Sphingobacteriales bacterium]
MENSFSVKEVLQTAWHITRNNLLVLLGYSAVASLITFLLVPIAYFYIVSSNNTLLIFIGLPILLIITSFLTLGFYKLVFKIIDSEVDDFDFKSIVPSWKNVSSFISLWLMYATFIFILKLIYTKLLNINAFQLFVETVKNNPYLIGVLSFVAFIIFILTIMRFMFFPCFIIDDDSTSFHSLSQSRELTYGNITRIVTVLLLVIGFIVLGFRALGVGIIVTYPFANVILVVTYRKLVYSYGVQHPGEQLIK